MHVRVDLGESQLQQRKKKNNNKQTEMCIPCIAEGFLGPVLLFLPHEIAPATRTLSCNARNVCFMHLISCKQYELC